MFPCVARKTGLVARLREKCLGVPLPLGRYLRQEQAAEPAFLDVESVTADLDLPRPGNRFEAANQREPDVRLVDVRRGDRRTAGVGGTRGWVDAAATAQRGTTLPSGSFGSMCPMQPRSSPCL